MDKTLSADQFATYLAKQKHSIKLSPHLTAGEASFLLGTMPEETLDFLRNTPPFRLKGEPSDAFLIRRVLQRQLKTTTP